MFKKMAVPAAMPVSYETMPVSEARGQFKSLMQQVAFRQRRVLLTNHSEPMAVVVPTHDLKVLEWVDGLNRDQRLKEAKARGLSKRTKHIDHSLLDGEADRAVAGPLAAGIDAPSVTSVEAMLAGLAPQAAAGADGERAACHAQLLQGIRAATALAEVMATSLEKMESKESDRVARSADCRKLLQLLGSIEVYAQKLKMG